MRNSKRFHLLNENEFAELKAGAEEALAHAAGKKITLRIRSLPRRMGLFSSCSSFPNGGVQIHNCLRDGGHGGQFDRVEGGVGFAIADGDEFDRAFRLMLKASGLVLEQFQQKPQLVAIGHPSG